MVRKGGWRWESNTPQQPLEGVSGSGLPHTAGEAGGGAWGGEDNSTPEQPLEGASGSDLPHTGDAATLDRPLAPQKSAGEAARHSAAESSFG